MEEIITRLVKERAIETILNRLSCGRENIEDLKDLEQEIFLILLDKGEEFVKKLDETGQLNYFICSCAKKQMHSSTSPYYLTYKKFKNLSIEIDDTI